MSKGLLFWLLMILWLLFGFWGFYSAWTGQYVLAGGSLLLFVLLGLLGWKVFGPPVQG